MAIQVASPFSQFDTMSEIVTEGSLFGINPASGRSCSYVYSTGTDYFQILRNLMKAIPNQSTYPGISPTVVNDSFTRPLPLNFEQAQFTSSRYLSAYIDETLMYSTSGLNLCTVMNLGTGNFNSPVVTPSQLGIKNQNFDFYCEMQSQYGGECSTTRDKKIRAFLLISQNLPAYTGDINIRIQNSNAIELQVNDMGNFRYSISGYINSNSIFFNDSNWSSSNGRLSLVVLNENVGNFGAYGMGSLTFYFPDNNCCTWDKVWEDGFVAPTESSIFDAITHSDLSTFISTALDIIPHLGSEFAFWLTPMGYIISVQQFEIILGLALVFIVLEKFAI